MMTKGSPAAASAIRATAFVRKELVEIIRQPRLVVTLVLGPFLILLLFGMGLKEIDPPLRTVFVAPEDARLTREVVAFADAQGSRLLVEEVTRDEQTALQRLDRGEVDLVIVFPDGVIDMVRANRRAMIVMYHTQIDPIETRALFLSARAAIDQINNQLLRTVVTEAQERSEDAEGRVAEARHRVGQLRQAVDQGDALAAQVEFERLQRQLNTLSLILPSGLSFWGQEAAVVAGAGADGVAGATARGSVAARLAAVTGENVEDLTPERLTQIEIDLDQVAVALREFRELSPRVLVSPLRGRLARLAVGTVGLTDFYSPAVMALLMQHMVVTFVGLSVVRDEQLGTTELFRVAPLTTLELLLGKYLSYLLLGGAVTAVLVLLLIFGLGVPLASSWLLLTASVAAVLFASTGLGFLIALIARSDSQAVQYAMMVLLASIFLSGFFLALDRFLPALQTVAWVLPATHSIELLRNVMLRGVAEGSITLARLAAMGAGLFGASWLLLHWRMQPR